jgi:predicted peptidase
VSTRPVVLVLLLAALASSACTRHSQFLEREVRLGGHSYKYRVWLPHHYTKLRRWPVVLFLHGSGERGSDNTSQLNTGLGPALERYGERYKTVVVFPQAESGHGWYGEMETMAIAELNEAMREFRGDQRRVYLTGISIGGAGTWYMARHNRKWAALVPVCGEVAQQPDDPFPSDLPPDIARIVGARDPYATLAGQIGQTPVWAFHGAMDHIVPVTESRSMVNALRQISVNIQYTEYPNGNHNVWDAAYGDAALVHWMLQQKMK